MITLETLKAELANAILVYLNHAERMEKQGNTRAYSSLQIIELNSLINDSTKIMLLHQVMLEYLEDKLPRPFGERMRYAFGIERESDLHNNLLKILTQAKYQSDRLERIDERAQWDEEYRIKLNNVRQELLEHPEIVANEEIKRLNKINAELQKLVGQLQKDLQTTQQERDYWHRMYDMVKEQGKIAHMEKTQSEKKLKLANKEIERLKAQNSHQAKTNPSNFMPRKQ